MGITRLPGSGNAHQFQHFLYLFPHLRLAKPIVVMELKHLLYLVLHREHRVQAGHGVLEYHGYLLSPHAQHFTFLQIQQIFTLKQDLSLSHLPNPVRQEAHDGQRGGGLSCACLANQPKGLLCVHIQADAVYCMDRFFVCLVYYFQIFDFQ